jgi:1,4-dihydroxy-2-naphthoyl-CoA hydrolase
VPARRGAWLHARVTLVDDLNTGMRSGFVSFLGLTFNEADTERVVASWPVTPDLHQPYGIVHGGVYCTVIETLASVAGAVWLGDRGQVVGVSNQTDFLRAAREGVMTATATPLHRGRLQQLWVVEVRDERDRLMARGQVRLQNIEAKRLAATEGSTGG